MKTLSQIRSEVYNSKTRKKTKSYRNIKKMIINLSRQHGFVYKFCSNSIFIRSLLDLWYIQFDENNMVLLRHSATINEEYHRQKLNADVMKDISKVFKYISNHDQYKLSEEYKKHKNYVKI